MTNDKQLGIPTIHKRAWIPATNVISQGSEFVDLTDEGDHHFIRRNHKFNTEPHDHNDDFLMGIFTKSAPLEQSSADFGDKFTIALGSLYRKRPEGAFTMHPVASNFIVDDFYTDELKKEAFSRQKEEILEKTIQISENLHSIKQAKSAESENDAGSSIGDHPISVPIGVIGTMFVAMFAGLQVTSVLSDNIYISPLVALCGIIGGLGFVAMHFAHARGVKM